MENTEAPLSKTEYNYIRTIEKADELIAKQDTALKQEKTANEQMSMELEAIKLAKGVSDKEITGLKSEIEKLKADLIETTKECQLHVDNIEVQNDNLMEQIEVLKGQILPEEEMLFYHSCKADIILAELYKERREFTIEELKEKKFPVVVLETDGSEPSGIETSNFKLIKNTNENEYQLSKK
jgi:hypothetical protein